VSTTTARQRKTVGDLVRSLSLVLGFVAVLVIFNVIQQPDHSDKALDYPAVLGTNEAQAPYAIVGPQPLPDGWRVTSARARAAGEAVTWHLGMVTDDEAYVGVEQSDGFAKDFIAQFADGAEEAGAVTVGEQEWQRLTGGDPEPRALLREHDGVVTMVVGSAPWVDLRTAAGSLAPAP
jgi:hypothetical protein